MAPARWAKRAYERSKELLEQGGRGGGWCADTKHCLEQLGLQEWWSSQQVPEDWKESVRKAVLHSEVRQWLEQVRGNGKLQLYSLVKQAFGRELYLQCPDAQHRRLWTKLRAGALELRVETGRWERVSVGGRQVPVPRYLRECELCWAGVLRTRGPFCLDVQASRVCGEHFGGQSQAMATCPPMWLKQLRS